MAVKYHQGKFKPNHPEKYMGDASNIIYRSSWEFDFLRYLDMNEEIVGYSSEEFFIPYISPLDNSLHRYFPDALIKKKSGEVLVIEIKPFQETLEPQRAKKTKKRFLAEASTYVVNQAKWKAAQYYCKERGWKFQVITEKELYGGKRG